MWSKKKLCRALRRFRRACVWIVVIGIVGSGVITLGLVTNFWFSLVNKRVLVKSTALPFVWPSNFRCPYDQNVNHNSIIPYIRNQEPTPPKWMSRANFDPPFYLVEVIMVRIYEDDKARWTIKELVQWIHFMLWAGVEHIYVCDHFKSDSERLDIKLKRYIEEKIVTYIPWNRSGNPMHAQVDCYKEVHSKYGSLTSWMITIDMDEYPSVTSDYAEGFLMRYLRQLDNSTAAIQLQNYLMLGAGDWSRDMVIERINRITPEKANNLGKVIFRPSKAMPGIHEAFMKTRNKNTLSLKANVNEIRLIHYWGRRLQEWGPDTPKTLNITKVYNNMRHNAAPFIRMSLLFYGECSAFSSQSGP